MQRAWFLQFESRESNTRIIAEQTGRRTEYRQNTDTWGLRPSFSISSFTVEQVDFCSQCNAPKTFPHVSQSTEWLKMELNITNFMSPGGKCSSFLTTYKRRGNITWLNKHWGWSIRLYQMILLNAWTESQLLYYIWKCPWPRPHKKGAEATSYSRPFGQWWLNVSEYRLSM